MRRIVIFTLLMLAGRCAFAQYGQLQFQLQNAQGQAISGATVYVYFQGTGSVSTCGQTSSGVQAQLYKTASGTTLTQPVTTDGFGQAVAYAAQGCYTVVYNSPYTGTQTFVDQNSIAASAITGGGGGGNDSIGSLINVTAAPYAAACNGTTDDTTAIQSAITAACAASTSIYIPAGKSCKVTKSLNASNVNGCTSSFFIEGDPGSGYQNSKIILALTEAYPGMDFGGCDNCGVLNLYTEIPTTSMATAFQLFGSGTIGAAGGYGDSCINSTDWLDSPSPANAIGIVSSYDDQGQFIKCNVQGSTTAAVIGNGVGKASAITSKFYTYTPSSGPGETEWHIQDSAFGSLVNGPALQFMGGPQLDFSGENYLVLLTGSTNTDGTFEISDSGGFTNQINGPFRTENQAGIANACGLNIAAGHIGGGQMQASLNGVTYAVCGAGTGAVLNGVDWNIDGYATTVFNFAGDMQNGNIKAVRLVTSNFGTFGSVYNYSNLTMGYSTQAQILAGISHSLTPLGWFCGSDGCTPPPPTTAFTVPLSVTLAANTGHQYKIAASSCNSYFEELFSGQTNILVDPTCDQLFTVENGTTTFMSVTPTGANFAGAVAANGNYGSSIFSVYDTAPKPSNGQAVIDEWLLGVSNATTIPSRYGVDMEDAGITVTGDQSAFACTYNLTSGATNHCINETQGMPNFLGGNLTLGNLANLYLTAQATSSTQCAQINATTGELTGTGSACGSGGGSGISGLTANYIPLAGSATTITANSHLDDGVTTAATITSTEPIQISGSTHGILMPHGTAVSGVAGDVVYAVDATNGYAEVNENNTGLSRVCTASNGICSGSGTVTDGSGSTTANEFALSTTTAHQIGYSSAAAGAGVLSALGNGVNTTGGFPTIQNSQAITATATASVNWASGNAATVTANGNNVTLTLSNGVSGQIYSLGLCNDGTARTWTASSAAQLAAPNYAGECRYGLYTFNGTTYEGLGSSSTPSLLYGLERTAPVTSASGAFACWWDSSNHVFTCNENGSGSNQVAVTALGSATAGQFVQYIDATGTQHLAAPTGSGTVNSGTTGQVGYYAGTGTAISGETTVTAAQGGTGVANSATLTLGSSNQNWATLGTGIVKNTTTTGALTNATSTDVIGLFTGCSGTQYLGADGACHSASGSGTVTTTGTPASGTIAAFSGSTSITNATAAEVVSLFSTCSGSQYLGADGACHNASGSGTVTSVTFTGDGIVDSSTPSTAVTTSGTVTATALTQTANTVLAGPASGSAAAPTFRSQVTADLPTGTVYSATPALGSSDIVTCSTANGVFSPFATTITRPAFTTSGGSYRINFSGYQTSSVSALTFSWEVKDGSTVIYTSGTQTDTFATAMNGLDLTEAAYGTLSSATMNVYPTGGAFNVLNGSQVNLASQPTSFAASSSGTLTLLMKCSTNTAGNQYQLEGITITKLD